MPTRNVQIPDQLEPELGASQAASPSVSDQRTKSPRAWNWGAFLLTWIWGSKHHVWISFLALIPGVNIIMAFILGAKGNEWAWNHDADKDETRFNARQRNWALWGLGAWAVLVVVALVVIGLFIHAVTGDVKGAKTVAVTFIGRIQEGNSAAAYNLTDPNFKKAISASAFARANILVTKDLGACTPVAGPATFTSSARARSDGVTREATLGLTCGRRSYTVVTAKLVSGEWQINALTDTTPPVSH
jgi:hypothetical protein